MAKKKEIHTDKREFINSVWAYNKTQNRFEFDCKAYEKDGKWYWMHTDKYIRDIDDNELEFMEEYLKGNSN